MSPANAIDLREIALSDIDDAGRLRPVDMVAAEAIAASMARDGLLSPVDVCQLPGKSGFRLVAGGHRLAAAKLLGWETIPGFVRSANALDRKAREIAENIFKADLSPIDRAAFVAELYQVEKSRIGMPLAGDGRAFSAAVKWQKSLKQEGAHATDMMSNAYSLSGAVAEKLGFDERTIRRDLLLFKRLSASMADRVRGTVIGGNATALRQLAALEPDQQDKVLDLIEAGKAKGVAQALAIVTKKKPVDQEAKRLSTFIDTFNRMGRKEKLAALRMLESHLPKGVRLMGHDFAAMSETEFKAKLVEVAEAAE